MISYEELKKALYITESLLGLFLIFLAYNLLRTSAAPHIIIYLIPALILSIVGYFCVLFGVEAFFFREDPDIWR